MSLTFDKSSTRSSEELAKTVNSSAPDIVIDTVEAVSDYSHAQFRRLRIKTDLILLPILWLAWGLVQSDKGSISSQATFGIRQDTHLVGQQFSWLSTAFYLSYLFAEFPANWIMQRVHVGRTIGTMMVLWGVVVLCIAFAKNFTDLLVLRIIQGTLECSIGPAFLVITGTFFTTREHTLRSFVWGTAPFSFGAISDLCIYAVTHAAKKDGVLAPWKGISFFLGGLTIFVGIISFFFLGTPREVFWLSEDEKRMTAARTVGNLTGTDRQKREEWQWSHVVECLKDQQVWWFFFAQLVNGLPNGAVTTFGNLVYVSFGFTPLETILHGTLPRNVFCFVLFMSLGFLTLWRPNLRFFIMMGALVPSVLGMFLLAFLPNKQSLLWPKWGLYLMASTGGISGFLIQTFVPSNIAGRTKRTVVLSVVFIAYCCGNAIGAQVMQASDAPRYIHGIIICASMYALQLVIMASWRLYLVRENGRRNTAQLAAGISEEERERLGRIAAEKGLTDKENPHFRYAI